MSDCRLFECKQCGDCCNGFGGTVVTEADLRAIAAHIGSTVAQVKEKYCAKSGNALVIAQKEDGYCVFYNANCSIHPVKPVMCRRWPFIDSLSVDIKNWWIMASMCPGMRTDLDDDTLQECLSSAIPAEREPGAADD